MKILWRSSDPPSSVRRNVNAQATESNRLFTTIVWDGIRYLVSSGTTALLVVVIATTSGQRAKGAGGTSFRWDSGPFLELDLTHTIGSARDLDQTERASLTLAIEMRLKKSKDDLEITSPRELHSVASQSRVKFVDLNQDGTPEAIVQPVGIQSGCGATGNCPFWIFTRTASGYKSLLEIERGVQMFRIERNLTNNFQDIAVASHDSASEKTIFVYRFHKDRYRRVGCYSASWISTKGGHWRVLKEPFITPCEAIHQLAPPTGAPRH